MRKIKRTFIAIFISLVCFSCGEIEPEEFDTIFSEEFDQVCNTNYEATTSNYIFFTAYKNYNIPLNNVLVRRLGKEKIQQMAEDGVPLNKSAAKDNFRLLDLGIEEVGSLHVNDFSVTMKSGENYKKWARHIDVYFYDGYENKESRTLMASWHKGYGWRINKCVDVQKYFDGKGTDYFQIKLWLERMPNKSKGNLKFQTKAELGVFWSADED